MKKVSYTSLVFRFWDKLKIFPGECWDWSGSKDSGGYGLIGRHGRNGGLIKANRLSWMLFNGPIPDNMCVLHKCDNPSCTNPEHLFLGTYKDNAIDRNKKGRNSSRVGECNGRHKLSIELVKKIRAMWSSSLYTIKELSIIFNTPISTIYKIVSYCTWKEV